MFIVVRRFGLGFVVKRIFVKFILVFRVFGFEESRRGLWVSVFLIINTACRGIRGKREGVGAGCDRGGT